MTNADIKQEDVIKVALKELEVTVNLSDDQRLRDKINFSVNILCARIAQLEEMVKLAFNEGWSACDQTYQEIDAGTAEIPEAPEEPDVN